MFKVKVNNDLWAISRKKGCQINEITSVTTQESSASEFLTLSAALNAAIRIPFEPHINSLEFLRINDNN